VEREPPLKNGVKRGRDPFDPGKSHISGPKTNSPNERRRRQVVFGREEAKGELRGSRSSAIYARGKQRIAAGKERGRLKGPSTF